MVKIELSDEVPTLYTKDRAAHMARMDELVAFATEIVSQGCTIKGLANHFMIMLSAITTGNATLEEELAYVRKMWADEAARRVEEKKMIETLLLGLADTSSKPN